MNMVMSLASLLKAKVRRRLFLLLLGYILFNVGLSRKLSFGKVQGINWAVFQGAGETKIGDENKAASANRIANETRKAVHENYQTRNESHKAAAGENHKTVDSKDKLVTWPPYSTILRIADSKMTVIILLVNCGYLEFADNLVGSMLKFNVTNFALVPLDQMSYKVLLQTYPYNVVPPNPDIPLADENSLNIGDASFIKLNAARALIMRRFVESGFTVLYSDSDMYWKSNILPHFEDGLENGTKEAMVFRDGKQMICSCLIYMKPTNNSIAILHMWENLLGQGGYDQPAWNKALRQSSGRFKYGILDGAKGFPNGREYFNWWNDTQRARAHLIHNNWIVGGKEKKLRFQKNGMWQLTGRLDKVFLQCGSNITNSTANITTANNSPKN